ncbi:VOC family protein [Polaromonas sp. AER18D-145]|uniref:VOC family protein n=1 Tax=Polaromonas sp. AER18D-145 TaxID=1977060 RepID=UPI000BBB9F7D|nr:VOC family protein [Polaromonas sp. AER18D-145]
MSIPFRYRKLGYVALNVTDLERSVRFYTDMVGLDLSEPFGAGPAFLRCGADHHNVVLYPATAPGVKRIAFELESRAEMEHARKHLASLGLAVEDIPVEERAALRQGDGLRYVEPNSGLTFEYYTRVLQMALPFRQSVTKIARLGHVVLSVDRFDEMTDFLTTQLGFAVSDFVAGRFAFMRCQPNPLHHSFAIGRSAGGNHLNHVNFMVSDMDDIGIAMNRLQKHDVPIVFGPGRHKPSGSIFLYFLDPDGMTVEYSFGMEEFPEKGAREARMLEAHPLALDTWGSVPKPEFAKVGAIEAQEST